MSQIRIEGPYRHGEKWRCRLVLAGRRMWCRPSAPSPEAARAVAEGAARAAVESGGLSVRDAVEHFLSRSRQDGARPETLRSEDKGLRMFFAGHFDAPLARVNSTVGASLYERLRTEPRRTGRPLSADSHQTYLKMARRFLSHCVEQSWLRSNPLAEVKPIGRRRKGKAQLRIDEARALYTTCLLQAQRGDSGAAAALVGLLMALRPGEIDSRTARDLDDGGAILWVDDTDAFQRKTEGSRRAVRVPQVLRPILCGLARDKVGTALLWSTDDGRRHHRSWVNNSVRRLCRLAGVPIVCAHSLRGLQATTALHAGATPELVASVLGHASVKMTLEHYAAKGSKQASDAAARLLLLGKGRP
ncbi:MAG: tyrosine-type recombinase/integrase [Polyangia bacterium]